MIERSTANDTSGTCEVAVTALRSSWTRVELALRRILSDIALRTLAANLDTLLKFQETCLMDIHTTLAAARYKLTQSQDLQGQDSAQEVFNKSSILQRTLNAFVNDVEKDIVMLEISCQLLSRLAEMEPNTSLTTDQLKISNHEPLPLIQHIRALVNDHLGNPLTHPPFIEANVYEVLEPLGPVTVSAWKGRGQDGRTNVILNDTAYPDSVPPPIIRKTVQDLAYMLSPPEVMLFNMPQCTALVRHGPTKFRYVLSLPNECITLTSLRSKYDEAEPSLSVKISYAKALCRAVMFLHTANSVHKSIRPDNIIVTNGSLIEQRNLFLIGLEQIRSHSDHSALRSDMQWYKNIYRHPDRQGLYVQEYYLVQHDIYSLGVCLLELGLWFSFVVASLHNGVQVPTPSSRLEMDDLSQGRVKARSVQQHFIRMAETLLPAKVGDIYTQVVLTCLTCLEEGRTNRFNEPKTFDDEEGLLVGVAFIEKIMLRLENIVI